jgi:dTDP-4-dehydrorhamnose 3,5-epimerase
MASTKAPLSEIVDVVEVDGFRFHHMALPGVILVQPKVNLDKRGFFVETYHRARYEAGGITATFVQDNHSESKRGTLRGLHAQIEKPQGKLLRVVEGEVFDVAVDVRPGSPTFGHWFGAELSAGNFRQLYIPKGYLHGFCVLSRTAQVEYKCNEYFYSDDQISVRWDDPTIGIQWPVNDPLLSPKDSVGVAQTLEEARDRLALLPPYAG